MLSITELALIGGAALILFGPDQLPRMARKAGQVVREVQNTSQAFVREMERAADEAEERERVRTAGAEASTPAESVAPHVDEHEPMLPLDEVHEGHPAEPAAHSSNGAGSSQHEAPPAQTPPKGPPPPDFSAGP